MHDVRCVLYCFSTNPLRTDGAGRSTNQLVITSCCWYSYSFAFPLAIRIRLQSVIVVLPEGLPYFDILVPNIIEICSLFISPFCTTGHNFSRLYSILCLIGWKTHFLEDNFYVGISVCIMYSPLCYDLISGQLRPRQIARICKKI